MDSNTVTAIFGAISVLVGILGKTLVDYRKQNNTSSVNKRDDFTVTFEKMQYLLEKAEHNNEEQEVQIKALVLENREMKALLAELRSVLDTITIDPEVIVKINRIYDKLKDR